MKIRIMLLLFHVIVPSVLLAQYLPLTGGTLSGPLTAPSVNAVLNAASCGDSTPPSWCSGTDIGAWVNAAYAELPSTGGEIDIPPSTSLPSPTTCYSQANPIVFGVEHKPVILKGQGNGPTCLKYITGSGTAVTINTGAQSKTNVVEDLILAGPGVTTSAIGLVIGGSNDNGTVSPHLSRVLIEGFSLGLELGGVNTFMFVGDHVQLNDNEQNFLDSTGQENNRFIDSAFTLDTPGTTGATANSVQISGSSDWTFLGCSFDNVQLAVSSNASVKIFGGHFENPGNTSYDYFTMSGLTLEFFGVMFQQNSSSFSNGRFGTASQGRVNIYGGTAYSVVSLPVFLNVTGSATANNAGLLLDSAFPTGWIGGSTTGGVSAFPSDSSGDATLSGTIQANYIRSTGNLGAAGFLAWGGGVNISSSSSLPQVGTLTTGRAACIKSVGPPVVIGYCSTQPNSSGACSCN